MVMEYVEGTEGQVACLGGQGTVRDSPNEGPAALCGRDVSGPSFPTCSWPWFLL